MFLALSEDEILLSKAQRSWENAEATSSANGARNQGRKIILLKRQTMAEVSEIHKTSFVMTRVPCKRRKLVTQPNNIETLSGCTYGCDTGIRCKNEYRGKTCNACGC